MPTFVVLVRSLSAFIVVASIAVIGFLVSDTRALNRSVVSEPNPTAAEAPSSTGTTLPATATDTAPPETAPVAEASDQSAQAPDTGPSEAELPDPPTSIDQVPQSGTGAFIPARTTSGITVGSGNVIDFSVAAEQGSGIDPDELAATVDRVLSDNRSWIAEGNIGFRRIETGGLFTLVVATADTVDKLCAPLRTNGFFSCARNGWVALNLNRWLLATDTWNADLSEYRNYVINHEVGHYLARPHVGCPGADQLAPVMMQQTKGLDGCQANGWPYPIQN